MREKGIYSQSNEDILVQQYFGSHTGTLLSLGENDGKTLSNVYAAIQRGWTGVLVEPSAKAFEKLIELHDGRHDVRCYNIAIGDKDGKATFYESGTHLGTGDTSLISTLVQSETLRWKGSQYDNFVTTTTDVVTWPVFYDRLPVKQFDLVSIDCEGFDYLILSQMDLDEMGVKMLIVEYNGIEEQKYIDYASKFGMKLYAKNFENLILVR